MRILQQHDAVLLVDLANFIARAAAVSSDYLGLFCRMVLKLRQQFPHHRLVFALEGSGTLRRQRLLRCYKEGRIPSPEFNDARQVVIRLLDTVACTLIKAPDGEADDAIASYVEQHPQDSIVIISNDRDLWQLISDHCTVQAKVKKTTIQVDRFACRRILGVDPEAIPLMKALLGDPSDRIPRGVARVHAAKLTRLAQEARQLGRLVETTNKADYLKPGDKKKILAAYSVVKQHLAVTSAWSNLQIKTRTRAGDAVASQQFLQQHGSDQLNLVEIEKVAGAHSEISS